MKKLSASLLLVILAAGVCYGQKKLHGKFYMIYTIGCYHQLRFNGSTFKSKENCDGPGYQWGRGTYKYNLVDSSLVLRYDNIPHDTAKCQYFYSNINSDSNSVEIRIVDMNTKEYIPWAPITLKNNGGGFRADDSGIAKFVVPKTVMTDTFVIPYNYSYPAFSSNIDFRKGNHIKIVVALKEPHDSYKENVVETFHVKYISRKKMALTYDDGKYAETLVRYRLYKKFHRKVRRHDKHQPDN